MPPQQLSLGMKSNRGKLGTDSAVTLENLSPEPIDGGRAPYALYPAPGLDRVASYGAGPWRGGLVMPQGLLAVVGRQLTLTGLTGVANVLGGIPGDGLVTFQRNLNADPDIILVASGRVFNAKGFAIAEIRSDAMPQPICVTFIGDRFVYPVADGRFFYTDAGTTNVGGLNFYNTESDADGLVMSWRRRNELWLFGTKSLEVWGISGDDDDPFTPAGAARATGCMSAASVAEIADRLFWVDQDGHVRIASGYDSDIVSTPWLTRLINAEPDKTKLWAGSYTVDGISYYELSGANFTSRYSLAMRDWIELKASGSKRWRAQGAVEWNGSTVMGDHEDGRLYRLNPKSALSDGIPFVGRIVTPASNNFPVPVVIYSLHLDCDPPVTALGETAEAILRLSYDGGKSWGNPKHASIGGTGVNARSIWRKLGPVERAGCVFEMTFPAMQGLALYKALVNTDGGTS